MEKQNYLEEILSDLLNTIIGGLLISRYFNPVGAHPSYLIGEDPITTKSKNLMPNIIDVVKGYKKIESLGMTMNSRRNLYQRLYSIMDLANANINH